MKYFENDEVVAFRQDSVLSHCCIMKGVEGTCAKAKYELPLGRLLSAKSSDESVRGGVHFYGALENCHSNPEETDGSRSGSSDGEQDRFAYNLFCEVCEA